MLKKLAMTERKKKGNGNGKAWQVSDFKVVSGDIFALIHYSSHLLFAYPQNI